MRTSAPRFPQVTPLVTPTPLTVMRPVAAGGWRIGWRRFRRNRLALAALAVLALEVVVALLAPLVTSQDPGRLGPLIRHPPSLRHWFGTDVLGRDLYARVVYASRVSLRVGVSVAVLSSVIGLAVGALAGFRGGWIDAVLMRFTDVLLAFPYVVATVAVVAVVGRGQRTLVLVLGLLGWMPVARLARAGVMRARHADYVAAAVAAGGSDVGVVVRHILPGAVRPTVVYAGILVGTAILAEAALSFLGIGVTEPTPSWGLQVAQGKNFLATSPHLLFFPAAAIVVTVAAFVVVGEGLYEALDIPDPAVPGSVVE